MARAETVYVVMPKLDRPIDPAWPSIVASIPGVVVSGSDPGLALLGPLRVVADDRAAAVLRGLFDGALRVEEIRPRKA